MLIIFQALFLAQWNTSLIKLCKGGFLYDEIAKEIQVDGGSAYIPKASVMFLSTLKSSCVS